MTLRSILHDQAQSPALVLESATSFPMSTQEPVDHTSIKMKSPHDLDIALQPTSGTDAKPGEQLDLSYTPEEERSVLQKIDRTILPLVRILAQILLAQSH